MSSELSNFDKIAFDTKQKGVTIVKMTRNKPTSQKHTGNEIIDKLHLHTHRSQILYSNCTHILNVQLLTHQDVRGSNFILLKPLR